MATPRARIIIQQCLSARLQVKPPEDGSPALFEEINKGIITYICFLKEATPDLVEKMANNCLNVKLSESGDGKLVSVLDLPGDVLIVPQATLGGRIKGKAMQYHGNIEKTVGRELYSSFTDMCKRAVEQNNGKRETESKVKWGTYGNRQVLSIDTNGPYTHVLEF